VNNRPSNEPTRNFDPASRLQADEARHPRSLGCRGCPDFGKCGGLNIEAEIFDCDDFCSCADPAKCDMVCRKKPADFFARVQEIDGFDLETIARIAPCPAPLSRLSSHMFATSIAVEPSCRSPASPSLSTSSSTCEPANHSSDLGQNWRRGFAFLKTP
jgi:hypothetical protein